MLRANQTKAEQRLWYLLRDNRLIGLKFRRQRQIGPYIVDFVCLDLKLVIEADGGQHGKDADARRDAWFARNGYTMLRFWNNEILGQTSAVLERVREVAIGLGHVDAPALTPGPSPASGRGEQTGARRVPFRENAAQAVRVESSGARSRPNPADNVSAPKLPSPACGRGAGGEGGRPVERRGDDLPVRQRRAGEP
ncbi:MULTISPECIES: endonuclease domain-containing protein [unclassified Cupriavidus]|uniref:endonuclease domain-containing protein n=1 Tax=unclassified Cupriavidus TaxID=2640874 RepID=UPI0012EA6776|nr:MULTISPECIES: endonuclease domain-containing protein [unclassified Cupriavidus]